LLKEPLSKMAAGQSAVVELVRSSLRPAQARCGDCDHEQAKHLDSLGQAVKCGAAWCRCPVWIDAGRALAFADETPTGKLPR
jgi:hypothetical protein